MSKGRDDVIAYRINRAKESLKEAKALEQIKSWNGVANRLYYACFYMVSALLMKSNLDSKTHSGTKTLFFKEFIKTGLVEKQWSEHYQQLFNLRTRGDYEDLITIDEEDVSPLLPETETFLGEIKKFISSK